MKKKPFIQIGIVTRSRRESLLFQHLQLCEEARELMRKKNADYSGSSPDDPYANFRLCESLQICSVESGILTRLADKVSRLATFCKSGTLEVKDESVRDTILDLINYSVIFYAYTQNGKDSTCLESSQESAQETPKSPSSEKLPERRKKS